MSAVQQRRVVMAPDKFKGTLSARELAEIMAGCASAQGDVEARILPMADGGDGSVAAALAAGWQRRTVATVDAWGAESLVDVAVHDGHAIVEVAGVCGLGSRRPTPADATSASTYGVGIVVRRLLEDGVHAITLGLGGSATTDAGIGMLQALGLRLFDEQARQFTPNAGTLTAIATADRSGMDRRLATLRLSLACDVDTPMVGPDGSAEMFGPQKGADAATVASLSEALAHSAAVVGPAFGAPEAHLLPGAGAAGGLAWAGVLLGGRLNSGSGVFLDLLDAASQIRDADLVITGEGRLDAQSLRGKAPVAVAELAAQLGVPTVAVVGSSQLGDDVVTPFAEVIAIDRIDADCLHDLDVSRALVARATEELLHRHLCTDQSVNGASA